MMKEYADKSTQTRKSIGRKHSDGKGGIVGEPKIHIQNLYFSFDRLYDFIFSYLFVKLHTYNFYYVGQRVKGFAQKTEIVKEGIKSVSSVPNYVSQSIKIKGEVFRSLIGNYEFYNFI